MDNLLIYDSTLRDGSHAIKHQLKLEDINKYTQLAQKANIDILEVGHGNGLGGSSFQVGLSLHSDKEIIETARKNLVDTKLATLVLPGFASINHDLKQAIDIGVDVFRVAVHCSEATLAVSYIDFLKGQNKVVYAALMMSHMVTNEVLLEQTKLLFKYGADAVFLFDSAGYMTPNNVKEKIKYLIEHTNKPIAFHAHNNLGLAVANTLVSIESGSFIVDGCCSGFGAGAGNTNLESIVSILKRENYNMKVDLSNLFSLSRYVQKNILQEIPNMTIENIMSGTHGVFSGFVKHIENIANEYNIDSLILLKELGTQNIIAGQEDMILKIALQIRKNNEIN